MGRYGAADYRLAASILWGEAGAWAVEECGRLNESHFGGRLPAIPIVIGLTAYGRCIGLTRGSGEWRDGLPRITLHSRLFAFGTRAVSDTILHEMIHAHLVLAGLDPDHNGRPWCVEVERLSPAVLGRTVKARPVHPRRVDGVNVRLPLPGHLSRKEIAGWPHSLRAPGDPGEALRVASH
jgi:hypothetical protein